MATFWTVFGIAWPTTVGVGIVWLWAAWRRARAEAIAHKSRIDGAIHLCESVEARADLDPVAHVIARDIRKWLDPSRPRTGAAQPGRAPLTTDDRQEP